MKILLFPPDKTDSTKLYQWNVIKLEDTSINICENVGVGPSPSDHNHYLKLVLKIYVVTFEQGVWHEGVGLVLLFSQTESRRVCVSIVNSKLLILRQL